MINLSCYHDMVNMYHHNMLSYFFLKASHTVFLCSVSDPGPDRICRVFDCRLDPGPEGLERAKRTEKRSQNQAKDA
jgi:hypothetical protein